jgi:hypothetical protein
VEESGPRPMETLRHEQQEAPASPSQVRERRAGEGRLEAAEERPLEGTKAQGSIRSDRASARVRQGTWPGVKAQKPTQEAFPAGLRPSGKAATRERHVGASRRERPGTRLKGKASKGESQERRRTFGAGRDPQGGRRQEGSQTLKA